MSDVNKARSQQLAKEAAANGDDFSFLAGVRKPHEEEKSEELSLGREISMDRQM